MNSEFEFLEARLRRQLPELTDAYGADATPDVSEQSASPIDDEAELVQISQPAIDDRSPNRGSRLGLMACAAGLVVAAGVGVALLGGQSDSSSVDPATANPVTTDSADESVGVAEEATAENKDSVLEVELDEESSSTTSAPTDDASDDVAATEPDPTATTAATVGVESSANTDEAETVELEKDNVETSDEQPSNQESSNGDASSETTTSVASQERGCVGNRVWNDLDSDGIQDPGEPGLTEITVELLDQAGERVAEKVLTNGYFSLCGPIGKARLVVEIPDGYSVVAADQGSSDHKDSDADENGSIELTIDQGRKRTRYDIGLTLDE